MAVAPSGFIWVPRRHSSTSGAAYPLTKIASEKEVSIWNKGLCPNVFHWVICLYININISLVAMWKKCTKSKNFCKPI